MNVSAATTLAGNMMRPIGAKPARSAAENPEVLLTAMEIIACRKPQKNDIATLTS